MKKCSIGMERFRAAGGVKMEKQKDGYLLTFPEKGGSLILAGDSMRLGGVEWTKATHLVLPKWIWNRGRNGKSRWK